jgi:hypothetical protein
MSEDTNFKAHTDIKAGNSTVTMQKWAGLASFLLVVSFIVAPLIYLVGNLQDAIGPFAYSLADFLYGPVWAASLVTAVFALRERIGERAPRAMSVAMLSAVLAAGTMVLVACIRHANRQYHLIHPELHLETSTTVLVVWTTLVAGLTAAGWHFLGWALVLIGSAGWKSSRLPRALCVLYLVGGIVSLFVFMFSKLEEIAILLGLVWAVWQGILLWKRDAGETQTPGKVVSQGA